MDWKCGVIIVFRPRLPKVPWGARTNAAGSYHPEGVGFAAYPLLANVAMGRSYTLVVLALSKPPMVMFCGTPLWIVILALVCQPPSRVFATELLRFKSLLLPIGRS